MIDALIVAAMLMQVPRTPPDPPVLEGEWTVSVIDNIKVMPDAPVTVAFKGVRVTGNSSCNSFQGGFTVSGTSLKTDSILTTMKACDGPRMSQERDFLTLLRRVVRYEIRANGSLVLTTDDGKSMTASRKAASR